MFAVALDTDLQRTCNGCAFALCAFLDLMPVFVLTSQMYIVLEMFTRTCLFVMEWYIIQHCMSNSNNTCHKLLKHVLFTIVEFKVEEYWDC